MSPFNIRPATIADAAHFVAVFQMASYGLAEHFWTKAVGPDGDVLGHGRNRMREKLTKAADQTVFVAEADGQVAGGILSYDIGHEPETIPADADPILVPLIEMENLAMGTRYINALAVFPGFEGRGIATALIKAVEKNGGPDGMSLIVDSGNYRADALYQRLGYEACARRHPGNGSERFCDGDWILRIKPAT